MNIEPANSVNELIDQQVKVISEARETTFLNSGISSGGEIVMLAKSLVIFQSQCPVIAKKTKGYGYNYADFSGIVEIIAPHLKEAGLAFSQLISSSADGGIVSVQTILMHADGGYISSTIGANIDKNITISSKTGKSSMTNIQLMGSIITYLKRYSLSAILGIVTEEDTDGASYDARPNSGKKSFKGSKNYKNRSISEFGSTEEIPPRPTLSAPVKEFSVSEAISKLKESKNLDDLKKNFGMMKNHWGNDAVVAEKDRIKDGFSLEVGNED